LLQIVISLAVIAAIIPWFLFALVPMLVFFGVCTTIFRRAVRQFKRMDNITRSPLLAHFGSTMQGLLTIRAYGQQDRFVHEHDKLCNETARTYLAFYVTNRWIGFRLDFVSTAIACTTALLCVALRDSITAGLAGLALVSALQLGGKSRLSPIQAMIIQLFYVQVQLTRTIITILTAIFSSHESIPTRRPRHLPVHHQDDLRNRSVFHQCGESSGV
jgi:ABC-type multidrug transport system fused ATPase/permease subunit